MITRLYPLFAHLEIFRTFPIEIAALHVEAFESRCEGSDLSHTSQKMAPWPFSKVFRLVESAQISKDIRDHMDQFLFVHYSHYVEFGFRTQQVFRTLRCHWPLYPWICQLEMTGMRETPIQGQTGDQNDLLELRIHHSQPARPAETRTWAKTWIGVATMLVGSKEVLIRSDAAAYLELFPSNHPNTKLTKLLSHPDIGKRWKMHQNHQFFFSWSTTKTRLR